MPPTIQAGTGPPEKRPLKPTERKSDLVCKVKYCNTLPDIPFDLKFITYPFDSTRFIQYNPTSLERNYRYEVLTEHDMGVTIDLIDKDAYTCEPGAQLDPADEKLLEEDVLTPQDSKRSRHHARNVSWLRRTEYISTEQTRFQPQTMDKVEAKVGYSIKKTLKDETLYMDRDSQIKAIEKTFEDSKAPITKHYSKPGVVPVEILPVFPDFKLWKYPCAQVIFDSDPAPVGKSCPAQIEEMSQAMIRGVMDESGEQFVAYFLPCEETLQKRKRDFELAIPYQDDDEYEYKMAREYNWNVKSKASKGYEENYFLVVREDGVYYNELETRVRLNKRRQKVGQIINNTRLVVKHRPLNANEHRMQRFREKQLEPPGDEDDEDEPQPEDEDDNNEMDTNSQEEQNNSQEEQDQEEQDENEGSENEGSTRSRRSRSKSRSVSKARSTRSNRSQTTNRSGSKTPSNASSRSHSGSRSPSQSKSRSRSRSRSKSRSVSKSPAQSKSRSVSKSPSRSKSGSRSRSRSGSRSQSRSPSRSRSRSASKSGSGSGSGSSSGGGSDSE